jgi:copper chaperone CopZ
MTAEIVQLRIHGMGCEGCAAAVEGALRQVPGVRGVTMDLAANAAEVELDFLVDRAQLQAAVDRAGYDATLMSS